MNLFKKWLLHPVYKTLNEEKCMKSFWLYGIDAVYYPNMGEQTIIVYHLPPLGIFNSFLTHLGFKPVSVTI